MELLLQMEPAQPGQAYSDRPDPGRCLGFLLPGASFPQPPGHPVRRRAEGLAPGLSFFLVLHSLAQHKKGAKSNMSTVIALYLIGTPSGCAVRWLPSFLFSLTWRWPRRRPPAPPASARSSRPCSTTRWEQPHLHMAEANYIGCCCGLWSSASPLRDASDRTSRCWGDLS